MSKAMTAMVVDLSHYDSVMDYGAMKDCGVVGVIYKATQGIGYQDLTYDKARERALSAGLEWGAYHFGDASDVKLQVANFLGWAQIDGESLFALDFESNGSNTMSIDQARDWIEQVEDGLGREGQTVIYGGDLIKEELGNRADEFFGSRRLWLAQYGNEAVVQCSWDSYWLWQYSGDGMGPEPHTVDGINGDCDCNYYSGSVEQLVSEWATGRKELPISIVRSLVTLTIDAPSNVQVKIVYTNTAQKG
jgi:GH25 family lysozyme M1 (1,4-beta-N-acetylmuramidase)